MILRRIRPLLSVVVLAGSLQPSFGHDTFETTLVAQVNTGNLEVNLTLSQRGTGDLLKQTSSDRAGLLPTDFDAVRPALAELAGKMIEISAGGSVLPMMDLDVAPGDEGDVEFRFTYPRPAARDVQVHAIYLTQLGRGYSGRLTLLDETGNGPIMRLDDRDQPTVTWPLGRPSASRAETPVPASAPEKPLPMDGTGTVAVNAPLTAAAASPGETTETTRKLFPIWVMVVLLGVVAGSVWLLRRRLVA